MLETEKNLEDKNDGEQRPFRLMFQDEGRFGRIESPHGCWCPVGFRPEVYSQIVREYTYAFAAVSPLDGSLVSLVLPYANSDCMSVFLEEVSSRFKDEYIGMVCDQASWHRSADLIIPQNIELIPLPPYSPELNPAEHIWEHLREKYFYNRHHETMQQVEDNLTFALKGTEQNIDLVQKLTGFKWILEAIKSAK